jgi:hypothetical protein
MKKALPQQRLFLRVRQAWRVARMQSKDVGAQSCSAREQKRH